MAADERLHEPADTACDQGAADDALECVHAARADPVRNLDADEGQRCGACEHPQRQPRVHGAEHAVAHRAERLEDRAVEDVGADAHLGVEAEEQDQDRRHQRAAAHPRHADEHADEQSRQRELPGHARAPGIGQETNGRPESRHASL